MHASITELLNTHACTHARTLFQIAENDYSNYPIYNSFVLRCFQAFTISAMLHRSTLSFSASWKMKNDFTEEDTESGETVHLADEMLEKFEDKLFLEWSARISGKYWFVRKLVLNDWAKPACTPSYFTHAYSQLSSLLRLPRNYLQYIIMIEL